LLADFTLPLQGEPLSNAGVEAARLEKKLKNHSRLRLLTVRVSIRTASYRKKARGKLRALLFSLTMEVCFKEQILLLLYFGKEIGIHLYSLED